MNGTKIVRIAAKHVGEAYILGALAPKNNAKWAGPWDCAEFVSWCLFQSAGVLYGCENNNADPASADAYTGYWQRDADAIGKKINVETAARTPGAAVLRLPSQNGYGHIVLSDGKGGTIEAHSSKKGVCRSTLDGRRWDTGILVPGIEYTEKPREIVVVPERHVLRVTSPRIENKTVRLVQKKLRERGFNPGATDGIFGPKTAAAVTGFQLSKRLLPDGEVGPVTAAALGISLADL